jgi:hypothetical protein
MGCTACTRVHFTGWTVRESNPGGSEIFRTCPDRPWGPPNILYKCYRVFPGGKERLGREADPLPLSSAVGHKRVEIYLYSPYGPYDLYRASVPVQGCTLRAGWSWDRIPVGTRFSAPVQSGLGAHPAFCTMGTGSFPGVKSGRSVTRTPHSFLVPLVIKE